jgi:hypothetical protein
VQGKVHTENIKGACGSRLFFVATQEKSAELLVPEKPCVYIDAKQGDLQQEILKFFKKFFLCLFGRGKTINIRLRIPRGVAPRNDRRNSKPLSF